jgi:outer membrane protein OmpA-like peptidoglycan-associated protein
MDSHHLTEVSRGQVMRSGTGAIVLVGVAAALLWVRWPMPMFGTGAAAGFGVGGGGSVAAGGSPAAAAGGATTGGAASGSSSDGGATAGEGRTADAMRTGETNQSAATDGEFSRSDRAQPALPTLASAPLPKAARPDPAKILVLGSVFFPSNETGLGPDASRMLEGIATTYRGTSQQLEIVGHADPRGDAAANVRLSTRRAEAVRAFLYERGVPAGNLRVKSEGERTPMARGVEPEANAQNRRVEVRLP